MHRPISQSSAAFLEHLASLPDALRAHLTGLHEHTHDGGKGRTVHNLLFTTTCMADWYAAQSHEINEAARPTLKRTIHLNREISLRFSGLEVILSPDGTYQVSDTTGG